jgi:ligand-binding sensor domain-containing protein
MERIIKCIYRYQCKNGISFSDGRINALYADHRGHIWMATFLNGLVCYDMATGKFRSFGKGNGLSEENIYSIHAAQYPYLWMTTPFGLDRFNITTGTFEAFFKKDGLPTDELSNGICYDNSGGKIYAGIKSGFIQLDALHFSTNTSLPKVVINDILINNQSLSSDLDNNNSIHLNYRENNLTVNFTAVDLVNGPDLKFRFRLNDEKNWSNAGKDREIHFSNLPPGKYTLLVQAANKSGVWNRNVTTLNFFIAPPFWETTWFYSVMLLFAVASVYLLYRFRIRQLQRVQEMRNRIAQDLHDDIGGTMTTINLTNALALQNLNEPDVVKKLLTGVSEDLKMAGETLDDIIWTVNPKNDSMTEVIARMRRYAARTWETAGIDFNFYFDKNAEVIPLNMEQRHDLYLVFKEAVNNVAKHSQCTHAISSLSLEGHALKVEIKDNGKGFNRHAPSQRNGIKNMQSRVKKWERLI